MGERAWPHLLYYRVTLDTDMNEVWIVDDDRAIRWVLEKALTREDIAHRSFTSAAEVWQAMQHGAPQVLLSDIRMPGESGLQLLTKIKERFPRLPVIVMTAYSDFDSTVAAYQSKAYEYLTKPFDVDHAIKLIRRARQESAPSTEQELPLNAPEILGQAPAMLEVFRAIGRLSSSAATVLITGESGTGKELVARALHRHSPRSTGEFIAINTAAIPKELLESELFGHEKGAFTGAQTTRLGRFEQAHGGSLFLDEIGDMPLDLQVRLLRVLTDHHFYRVGGQKLIRTDVRIIAATHQNLPERVKKGLFREDLWHRLNVVQIKLPALRERSSDIPLLIRYFLRESAREIKAEPKRLSEAANQALAEFSFPGNVRQLKNICHWLTVMVPGQVIEVSDLPSELCEPGESVHSESWHKALDQNLARALVRGEPALGERLQREFEKTLIVRALQHTGGRKAEAAQKLGWGRNTLTRKIQELGLDEPKTDC